MSWWTLSVLTGLMTTFGVMLALFYGEPSKKTLAFYLGFAAGIMSALIAFDLLPAAFRLGPVEAVGIGLGGGLLFMIIVCEALNRETDVQPVRRRFAMKRSEYWRMGVAMSLAIAVHHVPEGIAIGAGLQAGHGLGTRIALSIALHNISEGMGLAMPFLMAGMKKRALALLSLAISLSVPLGAWLGKKWFVGSPFMIGAGMAFAAGAMGFLVWKELVPISFKRHRSLALTGMTLSFALMILIHFLR